jgi:hypothetical protein
MSRSHSSSGRPIPCRLRSRRYTLEESLAAGQPAPPATRSVRLGLLPALGVLIKPRRWSCKILASHFSKQGVNTATQPIVFKHLAPYPTVGRAPSHHLPRRPAR